MKKFVSLFVLAAMTTGVANAAPSYIQRDNAGGYNITYDYTDKAKNGWYVGARAELGFWNWKNKYSVDAALNAPAEYSSDKYSFEPVFGGSVFGGRHIKYFWRAELEAGYLGYFEDKDVSSEFSMQIPYLMANGYYDFTNGLYVGGGVGIAMPITTLDTVYSDGGDRREYGFAPMLGVMLGYSHKLDDNLILDLRYRLAGMTGVDHKIGLSDGHTFKNDIDFILDNSISIGIRYEF